jgi:hypothetical protein
MTYVGIGILWFICRIMRLVESRSAGGTHANTAPPHPCQDAEAAIGSYYGANLRIILSMGIYTDYTNSSGAEEHEGLKGQSTYRVVCSAEGRTTHTFNIKAADFTADYNELVE